METKENLVTYPMNCVNVWPVYMYSPNKANLIGVKSQYVLKIKQKIIYIFHFIGQFCLFFTNLILLSVLGDLSFCSMKSIRRVNSGGCTDGRGAFHKQGVFGTGRPDPRRKRKGRGKEEELWK